MYCALLTQLLFQLVSQPDVPLIRLNPVDEINQKTIIDSSQLLTDRIQEVELGIVQCLRSSNPQ